MLLRLQRADSTYTLTQGVALSYKLVGLPGRRLSDNNNKEQNTYLALDFRKLAARKAIFSRSC